MAVTYAFDVYPSDDPKDGVRLVRLTLDDNLAAGSFEPELYGLGSGQISVDADHPDITAATIPYRGWVKVVRIDTDPEREVFGFWLEEGEFTALDPDAEDGGRTLTFSGPGGLFGLDRYVLGHSVYAPGQTARGDEPNIPDKWTWRNEPWGAMLVRVLEEGQNALGTPYAIFDFDFNRTRDSNNLQWLEFEDYQTDILTSGLEVYADFTRFGALFECTPSLLVRAYRDIDEYRTDRSSATYAAGKVRFTAGSGGNIEAAVAKKLNAKTERTRVTIRGRTGDYQTITTNGTGEEYYARLRSETTADPAHIAAMGALHLKRRAERSEQAAVQHALGHDELTGAYTPGPLDDYWLGDLVTLNTGTGEHDFTNQALQVASILFEHDETGNWSATVQLGGRLQSILPGDAGLREQITSVIGTGVQLCHDVGIDPVNVDEFDRTVGSGWGTSTLGLAYNSAVGSGTRSSSVGSGVGVQNLTGSAFQDHWIGTAGGQGWNEPFTLEMRFRWLTAPTGTEIGIAIIDDALGEQSAMLELQLSAGDPVLYAQAGITPDIVDDDVTLGALTAGNWMRMRMEWTGTATRGRVWDEGGSMPAEQIEVVTTEPGPFDTADLHVLLRTLTGQVAQTIEVDWIRLNPDATGTCIHGGPNANSGDPDDECSRCAAPGGHQHDYVAAGGTAGQLLAKASATDFDTEWVAAPSAGAPTTADYLVGTAQAGLSGEIVVGTVPGGQLGGTWAAPTVRFVSIAKWGNE